VGGDGGEGGPNEERVFFYPPHPYPSPSKGEGFFGKFQISLVSIWRMMASMERNMDIESVAVVGGGAWVRGSSTRVSHSGSECSLKELNDGLVKKCQDQVNRIYRSVLNKEK